jgi:hypothetical protein
MKRGFAASSASTATQYELEGRNLKVSEAKPRENSGGGGGSRW